MRVNFLLQRVKETKLVLYVRESLNDVSICVFLFAHITGKQKGSVHVYMTTGSHTHILSAASTAQHITHA